MASMILIKNGLDREIPEGTIIEICPYFDNPAGDQVLTIVEYDGEVARAAYVPARQLTAKIPGLGVVPPGESFEATIL